MEERIQRERHAVLVADMMKLVAALQPAQDSDAAVDTCDKLVRLWRTRPERPRVQFPHIDVMHHTQAALVAENAELRLDIHQQHGLVQVIAALDASARSTVQLALVRCIIEVCVPSGPRRTQTHVLIGGAVARHSTTQLTIGDADLQEACALVGGFQAVRRLTDAEHSLDVRSEALAFIRLTAGTFRKSLQAVRGPAVALLFWGADAMLLQGPNRACGA